MANKYSISSKQVVLVGLGVTALIAGIVIAVSASKKKKQLQNKASNKSKTTNSLMV